MLPFTFSYFKLKLLLTVSLFLVFNSVTAQFYDNFSDGDFTKAPIWRGDTFSFAVNKNLQLQLNAPDTLKNAKLFTVSKAVENATWTFKVQLDFNPSSSNYLDVYLMLDNTLLDDAKGYFVRIGGTKDDICLYRKDQNQEIKIIDGRDKSTNINSNNLSIEVTRNPANIWELKRDTTGQENWFAEGQAKDSIYNQSGYFMIDCHFTKTRANKFSFDDIKVNGSPLSDKEPPQLLSLQPVSINTAKLLFSESLNKNQAVNPLNYLANYNLGNPSSVTWHDTIKSSILIIFDGTFPNGSYTTLSIKNIEDTSGNTMLLHEDSLFYFEPDTPQYKDIIINEIYANPHEDSDLPLAEYAELYNKSQKAFDLSQYSFSDKTKTINLPQKILYPHQYLILCKTKDTLLFSQLGNTLGTELPSLNNDGDHLKLTYKTTTKVDELIYNKSWYNDPNKDNGGWSMELINPNFICSYANNWSASLANMGGTPGKINSVFNATAKHTIETTSFKALEQNSFSISFSQPFDSSKVELIKLGVNQKDDNIKFSPDLNSFNKLTLNILTASYTGDSIQVITSNYPTCYGKNHSPILSNHLFIPEQSNYLDVVINEVLYDPIDNGSDFIEIYNNSEKTIDLKHWKLANFDNDTIDNHHSLADSTLLFKPKEYKVITKNKASLLQYYPNSIASSIKEVNQLPNYNNDSSTVYLINEQDIVIDHFSYNDTLHHPMLQVTEGVSLERADFNQPTNAPSNWHSASEAFGFASPGIKNSQVSDLLNLGQTLEIEPKLISPNGDGMDDFLTIKYNLSEPGCVGSIIIFNEAGLQIATPMNFEILSQEGSKIWEGTTDQNQPAPSGIYIVFVEINNGKDIYIKEKKAIAIRK